MGFHSRFRVSNLLLLPLARLETLKKPPSFELSKSFKLLESFRVMVPRLGSSPHEPPSPLVVREDAHHGKGPIE
jgi:hypothetical protein